MVSNIAVALFEEAREYFNTVERPKILAEGKVNTLIENIITILSAKEDYGEFATILKNKI